MVKQVKAPREWGLRVPLEGEGERDPSEAVAARGQRYRRQSGNMGDSYFPNIRGHAKPGSRTTAAAAAPLLSRPQPRLDRGVMRAIVRHANSRFAGLRSPGRCRAGSPSMIDSGDVPVTRHALQRSRVLAVAGGSQSLSAAGSAHRTCRLRFSEPEGNSL